MQSNIPQKIIALLQYFLSCAKPTVVGLRLSELTSLDVEQVSADTLQVIGKGNEERKIFLTSATKKALEHWLKEREKILAPTNALFITKQGKRMTGRSVQDVVKKCIVLANLEHKNISVHKLRHSCASLLLANGVPMKQIQEWLGHSGHENTQLKKLLDLRRLNKFSRGALCRVYWSDYLTGEFTPASRLR